jgi:protein-tyrosine-phosphatase/tRNA A37 threonylcarbamoyladenosine synthetase subunit TsaC/SUA5/YrdC
MPRILDWRRTTDAPALAQLAAQSLAEGRLVALPTETGYNLVASASVAAAVERLRRWRSASGARPPVLALRDAADALHWAPNMGRMGARLARRLWPGPLTLICSERSEGRLSTEAPASLRRLVCSENGDFGMRVPDSEVLQEVLRRAPGPLLLAAENALAAGVSSIPRTAQEIADSAADDADLVLDNGPSTYVGRTTEVRVQGGAWHVSAAGVLPAELIAAQAACWIVFVCTGNTCRSPLAEALCKKRLADRLGCGVDELPGRGFIVLSAGLAAMIGESAAAEAVATAQMYGADLAAHASRPVTADLIDQADHVLAMTQGHLFLLAGCFPNCATIGRLLAPNGEDIADPVGCGREVYEECARRIWACLDGFVAEVVENG